MARSGPVEQSATRVRMAGSSRPGRVRTVNQDTVLADQVGGRPLLLVADGMGGHSTGEVASARASETILRELSSARAHPPLALARALQAANVDVLEHARSDTRHKGMGTTLTTVLIDDHVALIAHVGDSRAYLLRGGALRNLTEDHSWVAERVKQGLLSQDEARQHRWRNVITNALGANDAFRLDLAHVLLEPGDRLLVASDGVTAILPEALLKELLAEGEPEAVVERLLDAADQRGSPDNVSAVVAVIDAVNTAPRRYELPPELPEELPADGPWAVQMRQTLSGVRRVEDRYPARGPMRWLRRQAWYPYRLWILASAYLAFLLVLFVLLR